MARDANRNPVAASLRQLDFVCASASPRAFPLTIFQYGIPDPASRCFIGVAWTGDSQVEPTCELLKKHIGYIVDAFNPCEARKDRADFGRVLIRRCTDLQQPHWVSLIDGALDCSDKMLIAGVRETA